MIGEATNMKDHLKELERIAKDFDPTGKETNGFFRTGTILFAHVLTGVVREWLEKAEELMKNNRINGEGLDWAEVRAIRQAYQNGHGEQHDQRQENFNRKFGLRFNRKFGLQVSYYFSSDILSSSRVTNLNGRGGRIRTCALPVPGRKLYQAELHPEP